jgi:hypothetical protein
LHRLEPLPAAFARYDAIGGALEFHVFEDADGGVEEAVALIQQAVPDADLDALRDLGFREIDDQKFYGGSYDATSDSLLKLGNWGAQGRLINPRLRDLESLLLTGGGLIPEPGLGGEFAHAFSFTPYGLRASPVEVQELFDKVRHVILPPRLPHIIRDWASPDLVKVSPIFEQGMEWWGVFLFTIFVPDWRRHTVIVGSTTD